MAAVHSIGAPWSALWTCFVTAKNSSLPWITSHSASMPRSRQQRDVRREQLGDAAAVRGGVHVQDPRPDSGAAADRTRSMASSPATSR